MIGRRNRGIWKKSERRHSKDDQKKKLLISILPVSVMEHLLKSAAMRSDVEGSYEELEKELLEYLAMIDQQNRKARGANLRVGGLATIAVNKERARIGSRRNSGRSTTLALSRSSGTTGGQGTRKARAKAQTNLMEKEVCPS